MMRTQGFKALVSTAVLLAGWALGGCVVSARPAYVGETVIVAPPPPQRWR